MFEEQEGYFDFQEHQELEEELDFKRLKDCPFCRKPIPYNSISCLYCGRSLSSSRRPKWMVWVAIIVIIAFTLLIIF